MHRFGFQLRLALLCLIVVSGCGGPSPTAPSTPSPSSPSSPGAGGAEPTPWPAKVPSAVIALGAADNEIRKAGADLTQAVEQEDLALMEGAADGLANLIEVAAKNVPTLQEWEFTRPIGDRYAVAFEDILAGALGVRDGIRAGDAQAIVTGSQRIAEGLRLYGEVRGVLADLVAEAVKQSRARLR